MRTRIHDLCRKIPEIKRKKREEENGKWLNVCVYAWEAKNKQIPNIHKCRTCTQVICSSCIHDDDDDE